MTTVPAPVIQVAAPPVPVGSTADIDVGIERAHKLRDIIEHSKNKAQWVTRIGASDYFRLEAWQLLAKSQGCHAIIKVCKPIHNGSGQVIGYGAQAAVVHFESGIEIGNAYAQCSINARVTQGTNDEMEKRNRCMSMAQTRACSKALRLTFSWLTVLIGYEPTTAEELDS